ncbi:MraZ protein [Geoalkalibacter ferrihydriticus]|uniref:Transcriptional regulator MraZ n=1 Tax=Geoalkalibacter ferrihydriticus TaxID=392333 RepID=A0A1G9SLD5_9BACT|nr:MraZ protein [Geoalkalibacter ferrihydriticus]
MRAFFFAADIGNLSENLKKFKTISLTLRKAAAIFSQNVGKSVICGHAGDGLSFTGEFHNSIDAKGRISIPARFREALRQLGDESLTLTKNMDGGLSAYPSAHWQDIEKGIAAIPAGPRRTALNRLVLNPAESCSFDKQGRIQLSQALRAHAGLEQDVVVVGGFEKIDIFSQARYAEVNRESQELLRADPQFVADLGL